MAHLCLSQCWPSMSITFPAPVPAPVSVFNPYSDLHRDAVLSYAFHEGTMKNTCPAWL